MNNNSDKNYIAHINDNGEIQTVKEHLTNVAKLCYDFAIPELKDICYNIGLLHDIGKYQASFQKRIEGSNIKVEHSNCGAKEVYTEKDRNPATLLAALCIVGHHSGLPNVGTRYDSLECSSLMGRLKRETEDYSSYRNEINITDFDTESLLSLLTVDAESKGECVERFAFFVRLCFSCLVDADSIDTKEFCSKNKEVGLTSNFEECNNLLDKCFLKFDCVTNVQKARNKIQKQVFKNIQKDSEIYLMNMPTGSGKTLTSMKCALYRARKTNKKRIIYIIPYNSIIDQTASVFEKLFGENANVLRHQSSFSYEDSDKDEGYRNIALSACENWNADIIITTAVQFFESLFSSKRGKMRKIHNMADSVLVFDEAHTMPVEYLQPCLRAVTYLTKFCNSEAIFLTATMPNFRSLIDEYALKTSKINNLVTDSSCFISFKRNLYKYLGNQKDEEIIQLANKYNSTLIVVNKKETARRLFELATGKKYHLSTYMTGNDRSEVIDKIKHDLQEQAQKTLVREGEKIVVISTSLIEAGVDLDFQCAIRELNGLDNILQTGGRCNREGKNKIGDVYIYKQDGLKFNIQQEITLGIINEYKEIDSPKAIEAYYHRLLDFKRNAIIGNSLGNICQNIKLIPFHDYSVQLIESSSESIIIPNYDDAMCLEELYKIRHNIPCNARRLQKYCVNVYENELKDLLKQNAAKCYDNGIVVLENLDYYDSEIGIVFEGKDYFI